MGSLQMSNDAKIEAPKLDTLRFADNNDTDLYPKLINRSLLKPGYLLSPNTSIITDSHLWGIILITLLTKSPKVTNATLRFDDWGDAQMVLGRLLGFRTETDTHSAENETLCPRLSELRLDFEWKFREPSASKELLVDAIKSWKNAGFMPLFSIYASWKGERNHVLITGD